MAKLVMTAIGLVLLVGCASQPVQHAAAVDTSCDRSRMEQVERSAVRTGTNVLWINCPQRRAAL